MARTVQQLKHLAHLRDLLGRTGDGVVVEKNHVIACRRAPIGRIERDPVVRDRKSTRLNSSHSQISYAVFCLKKKTTNTPQVSRWCRLHARAAHTSDRH